jgi:hypothetical protein
MDRVVDDLIALHDHDDGEGLMTMLHGEDLRDALVDGAALPSTAPDLLAAPFAHLVVDEAQELTDAEWHMLLPRVRTLTPETAKGLECDLVVLIDPKEFSPAEFDPAEFDPAEFDSAEFETRIDGAVDRYVAMTRATQQLVILAGA